MSGTKPFALSSNAFLTAASPLKSLIQVPGITGGSEDCFQWINDIQNN